MSSRRVLKVAEAIREVVGMAILTDLRDPRVQNVTVTYVEVSSDLRNAKVHVSVMGDEARQKLSLRGLQNAAGYLQQKVGDRVELRYTPRLQFVLDQGVKKSVEVARILREVLPPQESTEPGQPNFQDREFQDNESEMLDPTERAPEDGEESKPEQQDRLP